jgi:hypothetical protein
MNSDDHWLYSIDPTKTRGLIVDAEGFTVIKLQYHRVDLESIMARTITGSRNRSIHHHSAGRLPRFFLFAFGC